VAGGPGTFSDGGFVLAEGEFAGIGTSSVAMFPCFATMPATFHKIFT
jgi:hypothetical protein